MLAAMLAVPGLTLALLTELVRCWAMGGKPLTAVSHVALGLSVACPLGYALTFLGGRAGYLSLLLLSGLGLPLFYLVRQAWLSAAAHRARESSSERSGC